MIFKTIKQNLEDVYIAGGKINELNNLKLNATNITAYATESKGLKYMVNPNNNPNTVRITKYLN